MALSNQMTRVAVQILQEANPCAVSQLKLRTLEGQIDNDPRIIYLLDEKADGGFESIFTYIPSSTQKEQVFVALSALVHNSHFIKRLPGFITRIGFY